jgi:hypothetical protein
MKISRPPEFVTLITAFGLTSIGMMLLTRPVLKQVFVSWGVWGDVGQLAVPMGLGLLAAYLVKRVGYPDTP